MRLSDFGFKCFSQGDEDGILAEILRRLEIQTGRFVEIGVGPGGENNTRWLAENGWYGLWIGQELLAAHPAGVAFLQATVTPATAPSLVGPTPCGVFSLDIDGNDFWVLKALLESGFQPQIIIVEYNGTYDAETRYVMPYLPNYEWHTGQPFGLFSPLQVQSPPSSSKRAVARFHACRVISTAADFSGVMSAQYSASAVP